MSAAAGAGRQAGWWAGRWAQAPARPAVSACSFGAAAVPDAALCTPAACQVRERGGRQDRRGAGRGAAEYGGRSRAPLFSSLHAVRRLIREFEREARTDGMPPNELNARKKELVQQLNGFIGMKKAYGAQAQQRGELLDGA